MNLAPRHCLVVLATAVLTGTPAAHGQTNAPGVVTPDDVVTRTLAHSPRLRSADEELRAAGWRREQADAQSRLTGDVRGSASHYDGLDDAAIGPSLVIPGIEDRYQASAGVSLPLYTGGRIASLQRSAVRSELAARRTCDATRSDLALEATAAYWAWARAFHQAEAMNAAVSRMESLAADMAAMRKAGLATENDLLATDVQLDQTRLKRDDARRQAEQLLATVVFLAGPSLPANVPPLRPETAPAAEVPDLATILAMAATNRADLAAARDQALAAHNRISVAQADSRPQLGLAARYEYARPNAMDFPPADEWNDDAFVGATVTWSLWDGGLTRARTGEARAKASQADLARQQAAERVEWQVKTARIALVAARDRVTTCRHAETSAALSVKTATDLWKNGLARHSDVLDAEARLTDSQFQTIAALADVQTAGAQLRHATGTLGTR